ncbi:hypothetical protein B0H65DRAFT_416622, partial [Neurospora tetraspora]
KTAKLDFEARVPVPFSIFPATYREPEKGVQTHTHVHEKVEVKVTKPAHAAAHHGHEDHHHAPVPPAVHELQPPRVEHRIVEEEVHITVEEELPHVHRAHSVKDEEHHKDHKHHAIDHLTDKLPHVHRPHSHHSSHHDVVEHQYRSKFQPAYHNEGHPVGSTLEVASYRPSHKESTHVDGTTVDFPALPAPPRSTSYKEKIVVDETTLDFPTHRPAHKKAPSLYSESTVDIQENELSLVKVSNNNTSSKMAFYDEDCKYPSIIHLHPSFRRLTSHGHAEADAQPRATTGTGTGSASQTVTIPCHHIRLGDILILQGRPCQVIRISTSAATGQHRYLGVDLFTKQLHEESSFVSNPAPSVVVQTMLGPVFKQYRVLDMQDGSIVAMTETGDVKQNLPVIDQSSLWNRLQKAFESGRGSVRVLVVSDHGREMAVDMKVVHGSRL